jgi:hypothetical protein
MFLLNYIFIKTFETIEAYQYIEILLKVALNTIKQKNKQHELSSLAVI